MSTLVSLEKLQHKFIVLSLSCNSFVEKDNVTRRGQHLELGLVALQKVQVQPDSFQNLENSFLTATY